ncbi:1-acyl-sn-glycerol-3-phosphate acyltransferase [Cellulomonas sp. URHD0024]|uniref:lysophospholipid acyltransferase family protein n=1 Tax=Cellulomonas sp. URHD0024 TaxID=1302620 RepID=UPI000418589B|nr:lysophospholipid acyltransferase family protein [Cellulomonas sp. URHD0024]
MSVPSVWGPRWSRWVGRFLARVVWNTQVTGRSNVPATGPVLMAANHTGVLDGPLLHGVVPRPSHVLVKEEMFWGPIGLLLRAAGQISVNRDDGGRTALTAALGVLKRGGLVGVFPEGNRGRGDATSARAGIAWLALNGHASVVPVAVLGTRRTGESVNKVPWPRRRLAIEFGEPLVIERPPGMSGKLAIERANEAIRIALARLVDEASARSGIPLPTDDPQRERSSKPD